MTDSFDFRNSPILPLRSIEADFEPEQADTFRCDLHSDYALANPSFNNSK